MRKYHLIILAGLFLSLTACKSAETRKEENRETEASLEETTAEEEISQEEILEKEILQKETVSLRISAGETGDSCPAVKLSETDRAAYPELARTLDLILKEREKECRAAREAGEVYENVMVRRADSEVVSLVFDGIFYPENGRKSCYSQTAVIDTKTGKKLALSDVVTDAEEMQEVICRELSALQEAWAEEEEQLADYIKESWDLFQWTMDPQGLSIYFSPYAEDPEQIQMITLSFADDPDVIKKEYQSAAESWGSELSLGKHFYVDADGDGSLNALLVSAEKNEYGDYEALTICVDGACLTDEVYAFTAEPMLLHRKDGKNILFIEMMGPNDYRTISIYDISTGKAERIGEADGARVQSLGEEGTLHEVISNPDEFSLTTRTYLLGTYDGVRSYHLGADGLAKAEADYYEIVPSETICFTVRCPLSAEVIAADGSVSETTELLAGAPLLYFGTDNASYADLMLPDGQLVRLSVIEGWPTLVNGIPVEEALDGVLFAG